MTDPFSVRSSADGSDLIAFFDGDCSCNVPPDVAHLKSERQNYATPTDIRKLLKPALKIAGMTVFSTHFSRV